MSQVERAEYDRRWDNEGYSAEGIGYTPNFLGFMRRHLSGESGREALEVGCGDGFFSRALSDLGFRVTGIDLSEVGIRKAKEHCPSGRFMVADLTQPMPFEPNSFDAVWCSEVLEHLFSPLYVLEEMSRVLKPGGLALLTTPYHGLLKNLAIAMFAFDKHYDPEYPHIRFFTKRTLTGLVRKAGLELVEVGHCGSQLGIRDVLFPTNLLVAARRPKS